MPSKSLLDDISVATQRAGCTIEAQIAVLERGEPRHVGWASDAASALLVTFSVSRVVADPSLPELLAAAQREAFLYLRMHGAPRIYYSAYDKTAVGRLAVALVQPSARNGWCIFDTTASGAALGNALELRDALGVLRDGNLAASGSFDESRSTQG